jgi:predicted RNA-binding Zn-ribbon protein involved in translation (DUF1610 family)
MSELLLDSDGFTLYTCAACGKVKIAHCLPRQRLNAETECAAVCVAERSTASDTAFHGHGSLIG